MNILGHNGLYRLHHYLKNSYNALVCVRACVCVCLYIYMYMYLNMNICVMSWGLMGCTGCTTLWRTATIRWCTCVRVYVCIYVCIHVYEHLYEYIYNMLGHNGLYRLHHDLKDGYNTLVYVCACVCVCVCICIWLYVWYFGACHVVQAAP